MTVAQDHAVTDHAPTAEAVAHGSKGKVSEPLPLYPGSKPCIHSGWCCRSGPCPYGTWDAARHQCVHLTKENACAIYHEILARPQEEWWFAPAFGAGCCASLNPDRAAMLARDPSLIDRYLQRAAGPNPVRRRHDTGHVSGGR